MDFVQIKTYDNLLQLDTKSIESHIRDFIIYLRDEKKLANGTINGYVASIIHFYDCQLHSDINIRWKKIKIFQRRNTKTANDLPYTREQISKMLEISQLREKIIILLMASVGIRRGAIPDLRVSDLSPIEKYGNYKVLVYNRTNEKYIGYCTPECRKYIDQYLEWRTRIGERITDESPLVRKKFDPEDLIQVRNPKPISYSLIDYLIRDLLQRTGVREKQILQSGMRQKKTKLMECHGFRKYFETNAKLAGMDLLLINRCMGHSSGLEDSYLKLSDEQVLEGNDKMVGYIGAIDELTIDESNRLRRKVETLKIRADELTDLKNQLDDLSTWKQSITDNIKTYFQKTTDRHYQIDDFERLNKEHAEYVKKENEKRKSLGLPLIKEDAYKHS